MKGTGIAAIGGLLVVVAGVAALIAWDGSINASSPDLDDAARIAAGARVYAAHCASCHGAQLEGQPGWRTRRADGRLPAPPHDASGHTWHHPMNVLFGITKHGIVPPYGPANYASDMPGFGDRLSDEQIWAVLAFIRSRWPEKIRAAHAQIEQRASSR